MNEPEDPGLFARSEFRRGLIASWHVILRELREMGRLKRTYALRTACVLVPVLFVSYMVAVEYSQQSIDSMGRKLFLMLSWAQLLLICLIAPATTAGWLETERNNRTLEVLFTTPLTSAAIIGGKSLSRLLEVLLMTLSIVPVHVALLLLGGVERAEVMQVLVLTLSAGFFAGTFGILCSVLFPRSKRPVLTVYTMLILMWLALPMLMAPIGKYGGIPWSSSFEIDGPASLLAYMWAWTLEATHPVFAMTKISMVMTLALGGGGQPWLASWYVTPITLCALSVLMVVIASWRLRAAALLVPIFAQTAKVSRKAAGAAPVGQRHGFWFQIFQEAPLAGQNPVAWLVKRQSVPTDWRGVMRKMLILVLCISLICLAIGALGAIILGRRGSGYYWYVQVNWLFVSMFFIWALLSLIAIIYGALGFVREINRWQVKRRPVPINWRVLAHKTLIFAIGAGMIYFGLHMLATAGWKGSSGYYHSGWAEGMFAVGFSIWGFLGLSAATYGARCFVEERNAGTLDILLTTALSGWAIVWGKFLGFVRLYGPFLAVFVPCWIVPYWFAELRKSWYNEYEALGLILLPFLVVGLLASIVIFGMWVSLRTSTPTRAVLTTLVGIGLLQGAQWLLFAGLIEFFDLDPDFVGWLCVFLIFFASTYSIAGFMFYHMIRRLRPAEE